MLIRNAEALEVLEKVSMLVVDKTGLTAGRPRLVTVAPEGSIEESQLLQCVASLENVSEHPLAAAIVSGAKQQDVSLVEVIDFESMTGKGVTRQSQVIGSPSTTLR